MALVENKSRYNVIIPSSSPGGQQHSIPPNATGHVPDDDWEAYRLRDKPLLIKRGYLVEIEPPEWGRVRSLGAPFLLLWLWTSGRRTAFIIALAVAIVAYLPGVPRWPALKRVLSGARYYRSSSLRWCAPLATAAEVARGAAPPTLPPPTAPLATVGRSLQLASQSA